MAISVNTILGWIRIANAVRNTVATELMPGGLEDLDGYSIDEIKEAIKGFKTLVIVNNRFSLSPHSTKRLGQLTLWVKDRTRLGLPVEFENGTPQADFTAEIEQAQQRDQIRVERKKNTESLSTMKVDPPLKSSAGWDTWLVSVQAALLVAYGSKGVPLSYVIRENDAPLFEGQNWDELAINAAPHTGLDYESDRKTVHLFFLNNIAEDSDAYAYIQPLLLRNDGRRDIKALEDRYENAATIQARVNLANKTWEMLTYKNERALSFEMFTKKLTKALQYFDNAGRPKHDDDVIDWIWSHVQNSELTQLMSALKVGQSFQVRTSRQILQEIAKEIPNLVKGTNFQPRISQLGQVGFTFEGEAPSSGAHTSDGKLFCGTYAPVRWFHEDMKAFRQEITDIRSNNPEWTGGRRGGNRNGKGGGKSGAFAGGKKQTQPHSKQARRKLAALQKQNADLKRNLSSLKAEAAASEHDALDKHNKAGDAFGGKNSMRDRT
jgi:hypothetical protein